MTVLHEVALAESDSEDIEEVAENESTKTSPDKVPDLLGVLCPLPQLVGSVGGVEVSRGRRAMPTGAVSRGTSRGAGCRGRMSSSRHLDGAVVGGQKREDGPLP